MKLDRKAKIAIYGAGLHGRELFDLLTALGFCVVAFIDKNADKVICPKNVSVYTLESVSMLVEQYKELVCIISVNNVFKHTEIASELEQKNIHYIIYKNLYDLNRNAKLINELYDEINDGLVVGVNHGEDNLYGKVLITEREIPCFRDTVYTATAEVNKEESQMVSCFVPVELLFGLTKEYYLDTTAVKVEELVNLIPDRSILYFFTQKELFDCFVNGADDKDWNEAIELYLRQRRCVLPNSKGGAKEEEQHLKERYSIFQNMDNLYNTNFSFFYENPSYVAWNNKGYFNIQDGNNRIAFLLAKGLSAIPCKMTLNDYKCWVNESVAAEMADALAMEETPEYLIPHPHYNKRIYRSMPYAVNKLKKVCEWMYANKIETHGLNVLDIACKSGYWGQCFARMGARVTAIEKDEKYYTLCQAVNRLTYNESETVYSSLELVADEKYDVVFIPVWANDMLIQLVDMANKYIIIDTIDINEMVQMNNLKKSFISEVLCNLIYDGKLVTTLVLTKR